MNRSEARAAVHLRHEQPEPAQLGELLPHGRVVAPAVARQTADLGDRAVLTEPAPGLLAQEVVLLFVVERARHRLFGRPSTFSPRMFRWISFEPPAIVIPKEER
jgi:hypothetical protein